MLGGAAEVQTPNVKSNVVPIRPAGSAGARPAKAPAVQPRKPRSRRRSGSASSAGGGRRDESCATMFEEFIERVLKHGCDLARPLGFRGTAKEILRDVGVEFAWWREIERYDLHEIDEIKTPKSPEWARVRCLDALEIVLDPRAVQEGDADVWIGYVDEYFDELRRLTPKAVPPPSRDAMARWATRWKKTQALKSELAKLEVGAETTRKKLKAMEAR